MIINIIGNFFDKTALRGFSKKYYFYFVFMMKKFNRFRNNWRICRKNLQRSKKRLEHLIEYKIEFDRLRFSFVI